jgi:hypothetical protein
MTEDRSAVGTPVVGRDEVLGDYERVRREAIRRYNTLLVKARWRLQAALKRLEQEQIIARTGPIEELTRRIRDTIEYLYEAKL